MVEGMLRRYLIKKIGEHQHKKALKKSTRELLEITQAYLTYADKSVDDKNLNAEKELEIMIEKVLN